MSKIYDTICVVSFLIMYCGMMYICGAILGGG